MTTEHRKLGFPEAWLSKTYSEVSSHGVYVEMCQIEFLIEQASSNRARPRLGME